MHTASPSGAVAMAVMHEACPEPVSGCLMPVEHRGAGGSQVSWLAAALPRDEGCPKEERFMGCLPLMQNLMPCWTFIGHFPGR